MQLLIEGVRRFRAAGFAEHAELFSKLAGGQAPRVLFITCSDSRIVPHLITGSKPGDLFVSRNAGNLVPPFGSSAGGEGAAIEYAVAALGVEHVVVCGHSDCGAMKALLNPESAAGLPSVCRWLDHASPVRAIVEASAPAEEKAEDRLKRCIEVNVLAQIDNLRGHPSVAAALSRRAVSLHGWTYDVGSGAIRCYDAALQAFVDLDSELHAVEPQTRLNAAG